MTLAEFEQLVYAVAADSPICGIPMLRRQHVPLQNVMSFAEFIAQIEQGASPTAAR